MNRHLYHRHLNSLVSSWAAGKDNVTLLPMDKYIFSEKDFADSINHLAKIVYYRLAEDLIAAIGNSDMTMIGKSRLAYLTLRQKVKLFLIRVRSSL